MSNWPYYSDKGRLAVETSALLLERVAGVVGYPSYSKPFHPPPSPLVQLQVQLWIHSLNQTNPPRLIY